MPITRVSQDQDGESAGVETFVLNKTSPAVASNLLIAAVNVRLGGVTLDDPVGYTPVFKFYTPTGNFGGGLFYKIAAGGESSITFDWTDAGRPSAALLEYSGNAVTDILDGSIETSANLNTVVTSRGSGSLTPTQNDGLAVAFFAPRTASEWIDGETYTNGYIEQSKHGNFARGGCIIADLPYSNLTPKSTIASTLDIGSECYSCSALFKADITAPVSSLSSILQQEF